MKINIPIYRANKIGSDESIKGYLNPLNLNGSYSISVADRYFTLTHHQIDPSTLSIHFLDMLDNEGNKIFASLSEDGKGGDILQGSMQDNFKGENDNGLVKIEKGLLIIECRGSKRPFNFESGMGWQSVSEKNYKGFKVIGIEQ